MARRYQHVQELLPTIKEMVAAGKTQRGIAEDLGLANKETVRELLKRERRREKRLAAGIVPRLKGRPRGGSEAEIERLRMENKLLRDFLQFIERK